MYVKAGTEICYLVFMNETTILTKVSINYVSKILPIFDPLRKQVYYISLFSSISIWLTPLPLASLRSLWMPPYGVGLVGNIFQRYVVCNRFITYISLRI